MNPACLICGNQTSIFCKQQGYSFVRCPVCKFFFVEPMPTDLLLAQVYSPFTGYQSNKIKKNYTSETNHKYIKILRVLEKYLSPGQKVLDVGTSDGEFLYYVKNAGYEPSGIEPNKTTADIANKNGFNVFCGFLSESPFEKESFSALRLGDVLEHSNDPHKLLNECKEYLILGGLLVISIPNMDSGWAKSTYLLKKVFSLPWPVLTPPYHLLYFSKNNLDLLLGRKGFTLVQVWYNRPPTLKYELGSTHLFGQFRREKSLKNISTFFFGFAGYSLLYLFDYLTTPLKSKDFGMLCIYKKNA